VLYFYKRHLCRVNASGKPHNILSPSPTADTTSTPPTGDKDTPPFPPDVTDSLTALESDDTVYFTMNGPSEFTVIGSLKTWDVRPDLHLIDVPTLVLNGELDEARDSCVYPFFEGIKRCRWRTISGTSHMSHVEDTEGYCGVVAGFLMGTG
jgi:pimeloyl-ACP methyl ester carboxylesterase